MFYLVNYSAIDANKSRFYAWLDASSTDSSNARRNPRIYPQLSRFNTINTLFKSNSGVIVSPLWMNVMRFNRIGVSGRIGASSYEPCPISSISRVSRKEAERRRGQREHNFLVVNLSIRLPKLGWEELLEKLGNDVVTRRVF